MLGQVDPYQQSTEYTCSAAVEHAVLKHWGYNIDETTLAYLLKVDPINGSSAVRVAAVARDLGFAAKSRSFKSLNELKRITDQDVPVIARVLSWKHPGQHHFVVVTSIDDFGVSVMDPNVEGNRRRLSHEEMWSRWTPDRVGVVIWPRDFQLDGATITRLWWLVAGCVLAIGAGVVLTYRDRRRKRQALSGYYRIKDANNPPPVKEVLEKWACRGDKAYDPPHSRDPEKRQHGVFWYDIDEVLPYREYFWTRRTARGGSEHWDELKASMREEGWSRSAKFADEGFFIDPAHIIVGKNACAKVGEGNHRLAIARELGLKKVPVRFHFYQNVQPYNHPDAHAKCFDWPKLCAVDG